MQSQNPYSLERPGPRLNWTHPPSNTDPAAHHSIKGTTRLQTRERQNSIPKVGTRQLDPATKTDSKPQQLSLPPTVKVEAPDPIHSAHPSQNVKSQVWATIDSTAQLTPPAIPSQFTIRLQFWCNHKITPQLKNMRAGVYRTRRESSARLFSHCTLISRLHWDPSFSNLLCSSAMWTET